MLSEEDVPGFIEGLKVDWRRNLNVSPEVKKAKSNLLYHRKKIQALTQELELAEDYEKQLVDEEKQIENQSKPIMMRFYESLESPETVTTALLLEVVSTKDWEKIVSLTGQKVRYVNTTKRKDIIYLLWIVLKLRDEYTQQENEQALQVLQGQGRNLLTKLGDSSICWQGLETKEVNIMQEVVQEVEKIPPFVRRIVETFFTSQSQVRIIYREVSAQTEQ
eukprot:TRINITY_DN2948_c0_g1_i2.p1 TRINITY_DN2948_c0_g1~~TRINITY_DN2948_c0_g1_i2.p1  ORF type:complete len:220 (-),score=54.12 TRINITY_DN2948_c0_g1_i2:318-977(-)